MKVAIITITDVNYGNRLQNYALYKFLEQLSFQPENLIIQDLRKKTLINKTKSVLRKRVKKIIPAPLLRRNYIAKKISQEKSDIVLKEKAHIFSVFTERYMKSKTVTLYQEKDKRKHINQDEYGFFFAGSDQIWNPDFAGDDYFFLDFAEPQKRIAFAASIGYETLDEDILVQYVKYWKDMQYISVREESAAKMIEQSTGKKVEIFLDPTMLLTQAEWKEISEKPKFEIPRKYILCFFLGNIPEKTIKEYQREYGIEVIMLNDKAYTDYYLAGPSIFLYLIEHAALVLTDSFHCTVFSIIFHKDFFVFEREQKDLKNMFTRLNGLLNKMGFQERIIRRNDVSVNEEIQEYRFIEAARIMSAEQQRVTQIITALCER